MQRGLKAWTVCCQRHLGTATQGKPAGMLERLTISGLKSTAVDAFLNFCAQKERSRTEDISKAQYEKNPCSSGYKAASSGRHRHTLGVMPSFLPPAQHGPAAGWRRDQTRSDEQQPSLGRSALCHGSWALCQSPQQLRGKQLPNFWRKSEHIEATHCASP